MSHETPSAPWTQRAVPVVIVVLFLAAGAMRLNPFCLLEPDTPDYLFTARALALFEGYREIDHVAEPLHTFRPPGLPLLLAPLSLARPYDVVGAKLFVLACAAALLWLTWLLAVRVVGRRSAVLVALLVASSPYTLLHATEVVTEVPYLVCTMTVLLLTAAGTRLGGRRAIVAAFVLALVPLLRTIGLALTAAVGAWALRGRERRRWLAAAAASAGVAVAWAVRSSSAGGPTYAASIVSGLRRDGVLGFLAGVADKLAYYAVSLGDVLLPGFRPAQPLYERVLLEPAADLGPAGGVAVPLGLLLAGLALGGMLRRRGEEGGIAAGYAALFVAGLAVYPPRHERLLWPLVPLVWVYAPVGCAWVGEFLASRRPVPRTSFSRAARVFALALALWQAWASAGIVRTNLRWSVAPARFHAEQAPPSYYCDWQAAGRWIGAHAPPHAVVLTRHSDVGFTARRYQDSLRFEELSPLRWRARLAELRARYLVVPTARFGRYFSRTMLDADPAYRFAPVYDELGVMVLEVRPNRSGTVRTDKPLEDLAACRRAVERHPGRIELARRLTELLAAAGRQDEALARARELAGAHPRDPGVHKTLGSLLLDADRPGEALDSFRKAARQPEAERLARSIERGIERARAELQGSAPPPQRAAELARMAQRQLAILQPGAALESVEQAVRLAPTDAAVRFVRGLVFQRLGRTSDARAEFAACARAGHPDAARKLALIDLAARVDAGIDALDPGAVLRLAGAFVQDGTPGRALALLEPWGEDPAAGTALQQRLAELYLFYGIAERAAPLFERVSEVSPGNTEVRNGAELAARSLRRPSF